MLDDFGSDFIRIVSPGENSSKRSSKLSIVSQKFVHVQDEPKTKLNNLLIEPKHISAPSQIPTKPPRKPEFKSKSFCIDIGELQKARNSLCSTRIPIERREKQFQALSRVSCDFKDEMNQTNDRNNQKKSLIELRDQKSIYQFDQTEDLQSILSVELDQNVHYDVCFMMFVLICIQSFFL